MREIRQNPISYYRLLPGEDIDPLDAAARVAEIEHERAVGLADEVG